MSSSEKTDRDVRRDVSESYAKALERAERGAGGCCGGPVEPAGVTAKIAGYEDVLPDVPDGAAQASFGCGNPLAFAEVREGQTVLDLGSGAGLDLILAAKAVGPTGRVIGIDMTDAMIEAARRNAAEAGLENVEVRKGIIEELPVDDGSVDWVISNCVINLSPDKPAVFREIHRVLGPGGRLSISDLVAENLPQELRDLPEVYNSCIGGAISEADYRAGLEAVGLEDVGVSDRVVYDARTIKGIVESDFPDLEIPAGALQEKIAAVAGKVASVRFTGRKP